MLKTLAGVLYTNVIVLSFQFSASIPNYSAGNVWSKTSLDVSAC